MKPDKQIQSIIARDKQYMANCVKKWKRVLVAENAAPIKDVHTRNVTAVLLENQSRVLKEAAMDSGVWGATAGFGGSVGNADSYAPGDNRVPKVVLPMIRRTFPELISNEITGVQPMTVPVSLAFAMRYKYEHGPLHEARAAGTLTNPTAVGPHYGVDTERPAAGMLDADVHMTQDGTTVGVATAYNGAEMGYNYIDSRYTGRQNNALRHTINAASGLPYTEADIVAIAKAKVSTLDTYAKVVDALIGGTLGDAETDVKKCFIAGGAFMFSDQDLGTAALLGDYEATGRIPKAKFTFDKKSVIAGTRRIGSSWTLELEQDIRNMNGINVEDEITSMMSYELQAEIDREMIVRMIYAAVSHNEYSYWNGANADARWMGERFRAFYQYVLQQSNRMALRNRRGAANFIVATPDVCTLLEALPTFTIMEVNGSVNTASSGIAKVGTVGNGRFTVFRDSRTPVQNNAYMGDTGSAQYTVNGVARTTGIPDFALLGYKGSEFWDAGIIFCPYIPIMLQRVVDPVSYEPNIGLMTRYGVVDNLFGSELYFHVIFIDTFSTVTSGNTAATADPTKAYPQLTKTLED